MLPLFGAGSLRDGPSKFADPSWWYYPGAIDSEPLYWTTGTLDAVHTRANLLAAGKVIDEAAIDKYAFIRDGWVQHRRSQVYDGNPPAEPDN